MLQISYAQNTKRHSRKQVHGNLVHHSREWYTYEPQIKNENSVMFYFTPVFSNWVTGDSKIKWQNPLSTSKNPKVRITDNETM
jgi:hypothetical protein